jgi:hypothetical protein
VVTQWLLIVMLFGGLAIPPSVHTHRFATQSDCERVGNVYRDMVAPKDRTLQWACVEVSK